MEVSKLLSDGDETKHEILERKFLGHLHMVDLKKTILDRSLNEDEINIKRNEEAYVQLINFMNDKSLSYITR